MKKQGSGKRRLTLKKLESKQALIIDRSMKDRNIIDTVLNELYNNSDIDTLNLENDIYKKFKIKLSHKESERLWEVMINSGLVNPVAGFGNAGKVELSRTGYQLMAQYGGYKEYIEAMSHSKQPQTLILPIQIPEPENDCNEITDKDKK